MATQLLFYNTAVPVSQEKHGALSVKTGNSYAFSKEVNSVPLTAVEFSLAAAEYPIVFAGNEESVMPAVILGARENENLFVGEDGLWKGKYIPAFVRRYPFVFSSDKSGKQFILNIDEGFEGVNGDGRGERLFDSDGTQTQYLKNVLNFLQEYQAHFQRTQAYCKRLKELDLLQPMQAQFNLAEGEKRSLSGFQVVNREKLKEIGQEDLAKMMKTDELECTFMHLYSLRHFNDMVGLMAASKPAEESDAPVLTDEAAGPSATVQ